MQKLQKTTLIFGAALALTVAPQTARAQGYIWNGTLQYNFTGDTYTDAGNGAIVDTGAIISKTFTINTATDTGTMIETIQNPGLAIQTFRGLAAFHYFSNSGQSGFELWGIPFSKINVTFDTSGLIQDANAVMSYCGLNSGNVSIVDLPTPNSSRFSPSSFNLSVSQVPEPSNIVLCLMGLGGILLYRKELVGAAASSKSEYKF